MVLKLLLLLLLLLACLVQWQQTAFVHAVSVVVCLRDTLGCWSCLSVHHQRGWMVQRCGKWETSFLTYCDAWLSVVMAEAHGF